ncbi:TonB-dependent receptor [Sphingomicrobium flavum]|uniref:TonB-dependent receptor n=1 Tax=Sphingomicrobium flavum TaxID=1229164 RepID=UPI0021AD95D2|nr:carboxypeptidase regulatory-like domain-containing protein [Sphingomicrobium flavum]
MKKFSFLLAASALSAGSMIVAAPAAAQQTTSGVQGAVQAEDGAAISGATVTVTDTRTGQVSTLTTGSEGRFSVQNLPTGGPYTVTATAGGYQGQTVNDLFLTLSGNTGLTFELAAAAGEVGEEAIVITGARATETVLAVGPGQSIGIETLEALPTINRDIRDFIRIDPRVNIETSTDEVDRISCLGGNDRANVFTVDGIAQADVFGLNGTPFASRNSLPLPFDAVKETAVEFAPFDVEYGAFTGCAINVVTKSGTNEFHGSAFFEYRDENLRGDTAGGEEFIPAEFDEKRWGVTLGGPIFKDRLFFFAGYEELDSSSVIEVGPSGLGFANSLEYVTEGQFNEFRSILNNVYGRDTGDIPRSAPESNVRYFGRLDAYINDDHRLELTYQRLEEENVEPDFGGSEFGGLRSFELEGTTSDYYAARLFSQWSDNFSTELRYSRAEVGDVQGPVGGGEAQSDNPVTRIAVAVVEEGCPTPTNPGGDGCDVGLLVDGPGIFRSANQLDTTVDQFKALANITKGDHQITIGAEMNQLDVYNLFVINATGTLYFENFADLEEGLLAGGRGFFPNGRDLARGTGWGADINATPTGDVNEAAAEFKRTIWAGYIQDDWRVTDQLSLLFGLRGEFYSGDRPRENPNFAARYGFSNATSFDDIDTVWMPRAAFSYDFDNEGFFYNSSLKGGVGIFSGGDPTVWFSNAFSNNGFSAGLGSTRFADCSGEPSVGGQIDVVTGGTFTGFPQCVADSGSSQAARGLADTQSTDPNIKIPTVGRLNLGFATRFGNGNGGFFDDWSLNLDYIYSIFRNPYNFVDLSQTPDIRQGLNGYTVDGRPIYAAIDPTVSGCDATLVNVGTPPVWDNVTADCFNTGRDDEIMLTNASGYDSHVASVILRKRFNSGVITDGGRVYLNLGYAYTDADERRTNDNSTATSGFDRTAAFDRQNPDVRQSTYSVTHNFSASVNVREEFFDDLESSLGIFFRATSGRPYSLVVREGSPFHDSSSGDFNVLPYIPTGLSDPRLSPDSDPDAVNDLLTFVDASGCDYTPGRSISANSCRNDWYFDLDLRLSQEIPGPGRLFGIDDKIEIYTAVDNFLNLLDGSWNSLRSRGSSLGVIETEIDDAGRYIIEDFEGFENLERDNQIRVTSSTWRVKVGIKYEF